MEQKRFDVIVIGGGPCGYTAALYCARAALDCLVLEQLSPGGQMGTTDIIDNYPGFPQGVNGFDLAMQMQQGAERFGVATRLEAVERVELENPVKRVHTAQNAYEAGAVILAMGASPRELGLPNERSLRGKGVSYCATCDASFFEDLEVFVVGGGDSAVEEAMYLTKFARKVTVIHRRDELRAAKSIQERAFKNPKLFFMWDTVVEELHGDGILSGMTVKNVKTGELTRIDADEDDGLFGVFGFIGYNPRSELFEGKLEMDRGYIKTDEDMHTNVEGVYAVGDIRVKSLRQVVTAAADGAIASMQVERWLAEQK